MMIRFMSDDFVKTNFRVPAEVFTFIYTCLPWVYQWCFEERMSDLHEDMFRDQLRFKEYIIYLCEGWKSIFIYFLVARQWRENNIRLRWSDAFLLEKYIHLIYILFYISFFITEPPQCHSSAFSLIIVAPNDGPILFYGSSRGLKILRDCVPAFTQHAQMYISFLFSFFANCYPIFFQCPISFFL